ncbi:G-protein coupled receptor family C group 6 member A [Syngnathoides biaculeatus]|uniref:G-protein coupled receptor family C group 6 member A n=1 Tax=Syngnathoides biaculeatus TaxID=300417 RepID=UPI002ADE058F|nr:G-protein coupled receptor family C group 6 member A [Syngnathoides biaculeatus]
MARRAAVIYLYGTLFFGKGASENDTKAPGATARGHVIMGGMFPIHKGVEKIDGSFAPQPQICVGLSVRALVLSLTMINAIEVVNRSPLLMDLNITLGYRIQDSCTDVSTGLRATVDFIEQAKCGKGHSPSKCNQPVVAILGAAFSEMSILVARQLALDMIPQISYSSTAVILSDKNRFPSFLRTVPNDEHQTAAMVRLISLQGWNWVGMIISDGDYGRSALEHFATQASEYGICIAFKSILPYTGTDEDLRSAVRQAAQTISQNPKAQVIVSFTTPTHMTELFQELWNEMMRKGQSVESMRRLWLASDSWSTSAFVQGDLTLEDMGQVVGFNFRTGNMSSFNEYLDRLEVTGYNNTQNDTFLEELFMLMNESSISRNTDLLASKVVKAIRANINPATVFSVELAVAATAQAIASVCRNRDCKNPGNLQPWEVLEALRVHEFEGQGKSYTFDSQGDINEGYDVTIWTSLEGKINVHDIVAEYNPQTKNFTLTSSNSSGRFQDLQQIFSKCSNSCIPGEFKKTSEGQHTCCYECINCTENYYSNDTDMDQCMSCDKNTEWSPKGSASCFPKRVTFFKWQDRFAVCLLAFSVLGILLVLMVSALFLHKRDTPVVRAAGGPLSQVILYSLVVSYISAVLFVGRPSNLQCKARQVLFGISFTVCVSCILVKSLKILLAFQLNIDIQGALRKVYQSYLIILGCVALQVTICISWLVLKSPYKKIISLPQTLLEDCHEGSYLAFGVMLGYIAILAFVCFICAFVGRKLPHGYNEAKFITFSMLLYLISWLIFVPIYITTPGVYLPAVEMVVILVSNYGILGCHFLPKCYIILFRKSQNTTSAFRKKLYEYHVKSSDSFSVSGSSVSEKQLGFQQSVRDASSFPPKEDYVKPAVEKNYRNRDSFKVSYRGKNERINQYSFHRRSMSF